MQPLAPTTTANSVQTTAQPREIAQPKPLKVEPQQESPAKLATIVNQLSDVLAPKNLDVGLNVDDGNALVIVVTDGKTGEMIRQIPSEEALALSERLEDAASILFNDEA